MLAWWNNPNHFANRDPIDVVAWADVELIRDRLG
jgi:hypothetical protein